MTRSVAKVLQYGTGRSATPTALDRTANVFPIAPLQASTQGAPRYTQPSPYKSASISTKRGATAAGLDDDDDPPGRYVPIQRSVNATPCRQCFAHSYNDHGHQCIQVMIQPGKFRRNCKWCADQKTRCDPLSNAVVEGIEDFWDKKETMTDTEFKKTYSSFRQAMILAPPTTRQGAEKQMREDLYLKAAGTARALARLQGLRHLIGVMVRGQAPVPPGSSWAMDPALWSLRDL